jgi:methylated-DNA-[protein]-cysteine S-methyltransferase
MKVTASVRCVATTASQGPILAGTSVPLASCGADNWRHDPNLTAFQRKVYDALCRIPPGRVVTYKSLAESIGCRSCQAVGQALRRNPYAPTVPCHRVVKTDLTLGGFFGHTTGPKLDEKRTLLQREGVRMDESTGKIDRQSVYMFRTDDTEHKAE